MPKLVTSDLVEEENIGQTTEHLLRDITAINEFLFCVESEPFINHEKAINRKRVPFKKSMAA